MCSGWLQEVHWPIMLNCTGVGSTLVFFFIHVRRHGWDNNDQRIWIYFYTNTQLNGWRNPQSTLMILDIFNDDWWLWWSLIVHPLCIDENRGWLSMIWREVQMRTFLSGSSNVHCHMIGSEIFSHHVCQWNSKGNQYPNKVLSESTTIHSEV